MKIVATDVVIANGQVRVCRPHRLGHLRLKTGEACHVHMDRFHRLHHDLYCLLTRCPHYRDMRKVEKSL